MLRRKKHVAVLIVVFQLVGCYAIAFAASESAVYVNEGEQYEIMKKQLSAAMIRLSPESSDDEAIQRTLKIARNLADGLSASDYEDSASWVAYIDGLIMLSNRDFGKAVEFLSEVNGQPGFEAADQFIAYAEAMLLMDEHDVVGAAVKFSEAGDLLDAQALFAEMTNPETITTSLLTMMAGKQYDEVLALIDEMERQHIDFEKSGHFADYARGVIHIDRMELVEALALFSPLAETGFLDSRAICEYVRGWQYQIDGELDFALACYLRAQVEAVGDAVTQTDDVLDLRQKIGECQYKLYSNAEELYTAEDFLAAKDIFEVLGTYRDSAERAEKCQKEYDATPTHVLSEMTCTPTGATAAWIEWRDTRLGTYEITYAPVGTKRLTQTDTSTQTYMSLDGLFPNTEYEIAIKASGERSNEVSSKVTTPEAEPYSNHELELLNPLQVSRYAVADEKKMGMEEVIRGELSESTGGVLILPDSSLAAWDFGFVLTGDFYCEQTDKDKEIQLLTVLRIADMATYGHASTPLKVNGDRFYVPFYIRLDAVLNMLYEDLGDWPNASAYLEVYFDGALLGTQSITLKKQ